MAISDSDNQIEVALTADFSQLDTGMAAAQSAVKQNVDAMGAAAQQGMKDFGLLDDVLSKNIKTLGQLAEAEGALDRLQRDGRISATELNDAFKILDATEQKLARSSEEAASGIRKVNTAGHATAGITAGVAREVGVLGNELANGNWHRLEGSLIVMANRLNLMPMLLNPVALGIAAVTAAVGGLAVAYEQSEAREHEFNRLVEETGGAIGVTHAQFVAMASDLSGGVVPIGEAEHALTSLAETGRFSGERLQEAGQAAVDMSLVTGKSIDECVREIVKLREEPVRAIVALNEQYGFLTVAQYSEIAALDEQGKHTEAAQRAVEIYGDAMHQRALKVQEDADAMKTKLGELRDSAIETWRAIGDAIRRSFDGSTVADKVSDIESQINDIKRLRRQAAEDGNAADVAHYDKVIALHQQEIRQLTEGEQKRAQAVAAQQQENKEAVEAVAQQRAFNKTLSDGLELQEKIAEAKKRAELIHKNNPNDDSIKGIQFDASGAVTGGKQWTDTVAKLTKEYDHVGVAADKAAERAERAHERAAKAAERHAAREQVQREQFLQKDAEQVRKEVAQEEEQRRQQVDDDKRLLDLRLKNDRDAAVNAVEARRGSAAEILNVELAADQQQLAADRAYYTQRLALDQGNTKLLTADENTWAMAQEKIRQSDLAAWRRYYQQLDREAQRSGHAIGQAMGGALKGILIQGQSFRQVMGNVFTLVAEKAIDRSMETLFVHQTTETAKTTATLVGNGVRTASDVASTQTSMALTSQKGLQSILTSAAETIGRVWSSISAIPYVGPFLAPAMAVAAGAAVYKLAGSIPSASGGWDKVPADTIAQIHKDEMVLPAELAQGVRDMAGMKRGRGSGDTHVHINALDMRSVATAMRRNPHALGSAVRYAHRMGHLKGRMD